MEGKYFIKDKSEPILKHEHIIFYFDNFTLRYNDTRKFGKMYLVTKDKLLTDTPLNKLGYEPWDKDLNNLYLKEKFNSNTAIKTLLLDQSIISGIGNIYADEILFLSCINPSKKGKDLKTKDAFQGKDFIRLAVRTEEENNQLIKKKNSLKLKVYETVI